MKNMCESPVMTFPIKKRINTELFIDRTAALNIKENWIREETSEGDQPVALVDWRNEYALRRNAMGRKDWVSTYLKMSLTGLS